MSITNIKSADILNLDFTNPGGATSYYYLGLGLLSTTPSNTGVYLEVPSTVGGAASNYSRVAITRKYDGAQPRFANATEGAPYVYNDGQIVFNKSEQNWGTVGYLLIFNHQSDALPANLVYWGPLGASKSIEADTNVIFDSAKIEISME